MRGGIRQELYEVRVRKNKSYWYLLERALHPEYDSDDPEEVIDVVSVARKMAMEQVIRWFKGKPFPTPVIESDQSDRT